MVPISSKETGQPPEEESHLQKREYQNLVTYRKMKWNLKIRICK